jgi:threonyl-tRNA synthetase
MPCRGAGLRVQVAGAKRGSLGSRIRDARLVPYQAIIGEREAAAGQVALRLRGGRQLPALHVASAIAGIAAQVGVHSTELWDDADTMAS